MSSSFISMPTSTKSINNLRTFVGGFEITRFVRNIKVEIAVDDIAHVELSLIAFPVRFDDNSIYIGEYPDDEFLAEMVRLKLRREGIMDEEGHNKDKA